MCSPWVYPVWDSLSLLDLTDISFSMLGRFSTIIFSEFFSYNFFLSSSSGTRMIQMLVCLIWSQRSLRLFSALFILFTLFSSEVISTILSSRSLMHSSASDILLLIPGGSEDKASACNTGDPGLIPGLRRSYGEGNGNPL